MQQIIVKIGVVRREQQTLDSDLLGARHQGFRCVMAGAIVVADDVEPAQRRGQLDCSEVGGRECSGERQLREDATERQHGFETLADRHDVIDTPEPYGVAANLPQCAPRRCHGRLADA